MNYIDTIIDRITMYRLLLYYLLGLLAAALVFSAVGLISFSPYSIAISASVFILACFGLEYVFSKIYGMPSNWESAILTGLILSLIITPAASLKDATFMLAASGLAISSKYILKIRGKHIFNPAAIAVVLTALGPRESASWWVGNIYLVPFVIVGGVLLVRKIRRTKMASVFILAAMSSTLFFAALLQKNLGVTLQATLLHSSLFFLAFVMLTEPATSPTTRIRRYIYAAIVGILFAPDLHIGSVYTTPEIALVIGNIAAFLMTPAVKTKIQFLRSRMYGSRTQDVEFIPEQKFNYKPGQYIEMTLPHSHADQRGLRRYFTLASSPTEENVRVGVRYYENGSTFKGALQNMTSETLASFGQLGGDFVLPEDTSKKLVFIAGGIGITPFRSMTKYLSDTGERRDVDLLYGERSVDDIAYSEVFEEAREKIGFRAHYILDQPIKENYRNVINGRIDGSLIKAQIPDFQERIFYISGPQPMVQSMKKTLRGMGVAGHNIKVDYFSGYA